MPPKPKEFESATLTCRLRALCGTRSIFVSTSGLSRLSVGGTILSRIASVAKIASIAGSAEKMAGGRLGGRHGNLRSRFADKPFDRAKLDRVGHGGGAVGVDIVDIVRREASALQRHGHAAIRTVAVLGRSRDVEGIAGQAITDNFGVNLRAARLGVFEFFENNDV